MDTQRRQTSHDARNRRFTIVAAVSLVCALIAGILALTLPAVAQTDADGTDEESDQDQAAAEKGTVEEAVMERLDAVLEPLVTAGTITVEQRDAVVEALLSARRAAPSDGFKWQHGGRWGGPGAGGYVGGDLAELLGLSSSDLRARLRAGETLAELAEAGGVAAGAVVDMLVEPAVARIDTAIENGRLDAADREACVTALEAHITARVSGDQPGSEADSSVCSRDATGAAHQRGHRWSAGGDRANRLGHGEGGAWRAKTGSWSPPTAAA